MDFSPSSLNPPVDEQPYSPLAAPEAPPSPVADPAPAPPGPDPLPLPIIVGEWLLRPAAEGLVWELNSTWRWRTLGRAAFFFVGALAFLFLGWGSLSSGLAEVSPAWLPYIAFALTVILLFSAAENVWRVLGRRRIVVDQGAGELRSEVSLTGLVQWRVELASLEGVLLSQTPAKSQGRRSSREAMQISQDVWLHVQGEGDFYLIGEWPEFEGKSHHWEALRERKAGHERLDLHLGEYDSPLHHAAWRLAEYLGLPVWVDIR